jgi:hypothetical protein
VLLRWLKTLEPIESERNRLSCADCAFGITRGNGSRFSRLRRGIARCRWIGSHVAEGQSYKAISRLLQDDIFQDVFENVGLYCGDSHCNVGDAKEECLDPPNQAKSNHQNSSDWKEPGKSKLCKSLIVLQVGQCLEPTNDPEEKTTSIGLGLPLQHLFKNVSFSRYFVRNFKNTVGASWEFGFCSFRRIVQLIEWLTMAQRRRVLALRACVAYMA